MALRMNRARVGGMKSSQRTSVMPTVPLAVHGTIHSIILASVDYRGTGACGL